MERTIVSCDPGVAKPSAFSVFKDSHLIWLQKTNKMADIELLFSLHKVRKLIIEDQFLGLNAKTLKTLTRQSGKIIGIAELKEIEIDIIMPVTWQSWHKIPRKPKGISTYNWKKLHERHLIDKAVELTDWEIEDCDEAASVLIGLYGVKNEIK